MPSHHGCSHIMLRLSTSLHVVLPLLFVELALFLSSGILVLLVLRDEIVHVALGLRELRDIRFVGVVWHSVQKHLFKSSRKRDQSRHLRMISTPSVAARGALVSRYTGNPTTRGRG